MFTVNNLCRASGTTERGAACLCPRPCWPAYARLAPVPLCPTCGASLDSAARFCPIDGTTVKPDSLAPSPNARDELGTTRPLTPAKALAAVEADPADPLVGAV